MWIANRTRAASFALLLLLVLCGLLLAWLHLNHAMFAVIAALVAVNALVLVVGRDGFRQTTHESLESRGIDREASYSPVSDSNLRRELGAVGGRRATNRQLKRQATASRPVTLRGASVRAPVVKGTAAKGTAVNRTGAAGPRAGRARKRQAPALPPDATVNLAALRQETRLDELLASLDRQLVGLGPVKQKVAEIGSLLLVDKARQRFGLTAPRPNLHMCFTGPPGTGKTTVALMMADLLHQLGYLESGHMVHAMRDDLVGQYIGQTAPLTKRVLERAMGGVLFIDEAYALFRDDDSKDFGQEAIEILMQVMENDRDKIVVILAGYQDRMDRFFEFNEGMRSRVAHHLDFPPYEADELLAIGQLMLDRSSYYLSVAAQSAFRDCLEEQRAAPHFAHGRTVRNALESARLRHAHRLTAEPDRAWSKDDLMRLDSSDVLPGDTPYR